MNNLTRLLFYQSQLQQSHPSQQQSQPSPQQQQASHQPPESSEPSPAAACAIFLRRPFFVRSSSGLFIRSVLGKAATEPNIVPRNIKLKLRSKHSRADFAALTSCAGATSAKAKTKRNTSGICHEKPRAIVFAFSDATCHLCAKVRFDFGAQTVFARTTGKFVLSFLCRLSARRAANSVFWFSAIGSACIFSTISPSSSRKIETVFRLAPAEILFPIKSKAARIALN